MKALLSIFLTRFGVFGGYRGWKRIDDWDAAADLQQGNIDSVFVLVPKPDRNNARYSPTAWDPLGRQQADTITALAKKCELLAATVGRRPIE